MLSEPRKRKKWSVNPNGNTWAHDTTKFGSKMLEKMGWTNGKGLGANEDGRTDVIKVKKKNDSLGVGFSKKDAHNWVAHQDDFSSLLSQLNGHHAQKDDNSKNEIASLEQISKTQKRVHYHRYARGKDLTNYKKNDLNAIFGKRSAKSAPATPADSSDGSTSGEDSASSCPDVVGVKMSRKKARSENQVTSTLSVQEYFAKRMAMLKNKQPDTCQGNDLSPGHGVLADESKTTKCPNSEVTSALTVQEYLSQRMALKKKSEQKFQDPSQPLDNQGKQADDDTDTDKVVNANGFDDVENEPEADGRSKTRKKKKSKTRKGDLEENDVMNSDIVSDTVDPTVKTLKKKKKSKSRESSDTLIEDFETVVVENQAACDVAECNVKVSKKKKKSRKRCTDAIGIDEPSSKIVRTV